MCGICGNLARSPRPGLIGTTQQMLRAIEHRGPDDSGLLALPAWQSQARASEVAVAGGGEAAAVLAMGNRRLSILDLSPAGHQPFCNAAGDIWLVYNGETYNYLELRRELESLGQHLHSGTDTEVVLRAYEQWGLDCFARMNGMWALAIWDGRNRQLVLARDHFGIKPLYYSVRGDSLSFASEIRALKFSHAGGFEPDMEAVRDFLVEKAVDIGERTFFRDVQRLPAASYAVVDLKNPDRPFSIAVTPYWRLHPDARCAEPPAERGERVRFLLDDSIRLRLRSDVPVGVCLSGGLDSSAIVVLLKKLLEEGKVASGVVGSSVKTFTASYPAEKYDEKPFVDALIQHSNLEAYWTSPTGADVASVVRDVVRCQEEPFGGTAIISQWFVFRLAREHGMKVMLDGQGADELFGGYLTFFYPLLQEYRSRKQYLQVLAEIAAATWYHSYYRSLYFRLLGAQRRAVLARFGGAATRNGHGAPGIRLSELPAHRRETVPALAAGNPLRNARQKYLESYSLPGLLRFEDKNSMHFSIESRLPFLDPRLVEYAFSMPAESLIHMGTTKRVLREAVSDVLPRRITERKLKLGFATPEAKWLRGELCPMFNDLFHSRSFASRGFFDVPDVQRQWREFLGGAHLDPGQFWRWGNLELWFREFID